MRKLLLAGAVAGCLALSAGGAQASPYVGTTAANNDVIGVVEGWFGAQWYLIAGASTTIDVYYLGFEAGWTNTFDFNSGAVTVTRGGGNTGKSSLFGGGVAPTLEAGSLTAPGLLNFSFTTNRGGAGDATVTNATNTVPPNAPNFFSTVTTCGAIAGCVFDTTFDTVSAGSGNTLLLALDDGGAGVDDNHDDLVVVLKINNGEIQRVPEPATLGLLGFGLAGLGIANRRRKA